MNRPTYSIGITSLLLVSLAVGAAVAGLANSGASSPTSPSPSRDFRVSAAKNFLLVPPGNSTVTAVTVVSLNGFSGPVKLSTTITPSITGLPTVSLNPSTLKLKSGGNATSTLTVSATRTAPTLNYTLSVMAQSSNLSHSIAVLVIVPPPDFTLTLSPSIMSLALGSSGNTKATLTSLYSFTGNITLSSSNLPLDVGVGISPFQLVLPTGGTATAVISVTPGNSAVPGTYPIIISGRSAFAGGFLTHTATLTLTISSSPVPDFSIKAPTSLTVQQGSTGSATVTLFSVGGFSGTVSLTGSIIPAVSGGPIIVLSPSNVFLSSNGTAASIMEIVTNATTTSGFYNYTVTGTSGSLFHTTVGSLMIMGKPQPDFSLLISPSTILVAQGSSQGFSVIALSLNGFTGNITLNTSNIPTGVIVQFSGGSPPTLAVPPGGNASIAAVLTVGTASLPGTYTLTMTGTSGSLTHLALLTLTITTITSADFSLKVNPNALTLAQNSAGSINITVTSLSGFNSSVSLSGNILPTVPAGVTFTVSPAFVLLSPGGTAGSVMRIFTNGTAALGMYNFTVSGISGSLVHNVLGSLTVTRSVSPDFTLTASPGSLQILQGSSGSSLLTITSLGGFSGTVSLNATVSPLGPLLVLGANSVSLPSGGTATVVLTVSTTASTPLGNYAITVTGVSTGHVHSANIGLTVTSPNFESLSLENYSFNSSTALILDLRNTGTNSISLVAYYVKDSSGNQYAITSWPGPTINPGNLTAVLILIGPSCPGCVLSGSPFTFTPRFSYTITVVTSRNNQFTFTVVR